MSARETPVFRFIATTWSAFTASSRRRRAESRSQTLGTYFCSDVKPTLVSGRSFELFYRSRFAWTLVQIVFFSLLAAWTLKNYVAVIKSL
ncbi:MAG: hypothetical protein JST16_13035 [Bdellovibrionales bacterium]|nr:hypothetical protein [Bdellovibrionales bacterium]